MAYSTTWDETAPVGNVTQASDIDLVFRNMKRDLRERVTSLINGESPRFLHWAEGVLYTQVDGAIFVSTDYQLSTTTSALNLTALGVGDDHTLIVPFSLREGASLTGVSARLNQSGAGLTVTFELNRVSMSNVNSSISGPVTLSTFGSWQDLPLSAGLPHTIDTDFAYYAKIRITYASGTPTLQMLGVKLTFDTTPCFLVAP